MKITRKILKKLACFTSASIIFFSYFGFISYPANNTLPVTADSPTFQEDLALAKELNGTSSTAIAKISKYADTFAKDSAFAKKLKEAGGIASMVGDALNAVNGGIKAYDKDSNFLENVCNVAGGAVAGFFGLDTEKSTVSNPSNQEILDSVVELSTDISAIKTMVTDLDAEMQEISGQLSELEQQLDKDFTALSADIKNLSDEVKDARDEAFLNEFNQTNNAAAFGYSSFFKPNLEKRYNELLVSLNSEDPDSIKQAYDNLYLVVKQVDQLYNYLTGETSLTGKRVLDVLYDYSVRTDAEHAEAINVTFAEDVYATYVFATYLKTLCYHYQISYGLEHEQEYSAYYYVSQGSTASESIQYNSIEREMQSLVEQQQKINETMAAFLTKVIRPNGEYGYLLRDSWTTVPYAEALDEESYRTTGYNRESNGEPVYYRENNQLSNGDVLALSTLPEEYISPFDAASFHFTVSDEALAQVTDEGILTVLGESGSFTVSYSYGDTVCYTISFDVVQNSYAGGMGIESAPYLISTEKQFLQATNETLKAHYSLANDLCIGGISSSQCRQFDGVFDGNGYTIGATYLTQTSDRDRPTFYAGLFDRVYKSAVIKNINVACLNDTTVSTTINATRRFNLNYNTAKLYTGIIAAYNIGTISNCNVQNAKVLATIQPTTYTVPAYLDIYAGGIVGFNDGSVANCNVQNTEITANGTMNNDLPGIIIRSYEESVNVYVGGIVGFLASNGYCGKTFSVSNKLSATAIIDDCPANISRKTIATTYVGGNIGFCKEASTYQTQPNITANCTKTERAEVHESHGDAYNKRGYEASLSASSFTEEIFKANNLKLNDEGYVIFDNDIYDELSLIALPHKRTYFKGEELNLSGLKLSKTTFDGKTEEVHGATVTGYDKNKLGEQTITATWKDFSVSFTITVNCPHTWIVGNHEKPTCEENGFVNYTCEKCGDTQTKELLVGDHLYGDWIVTKYPTDTQDGEEATSCSICGERKTRLLPKLDATDYVGIFTTAVEAISIAKGEEKLIAIQYAFATYENVQDKAEVEAAYAKLQAYVKEYNKHAQTLNTEFTSANEVAVSVIASVFSISTALAAILFVLKGKF